MFDWDILRFGLPRQRATFPSPFSLHLSLYSLLSPFPLFLALPTLCVIYLLLLTSFNTPLSLPPHPTLLSLPSPVYGGVVNAMSFLSLSAVRVASAGDDLPVDSFVFAEHSDSQCGVIHPELATCENAPFGSPLFR